MISIVQWPNTFMQRCVMPDTQRYPILIWSIMCRRYFLFKFRMVCWMCFSAVKCPRNQWETTSENYHLHYKNVNNNSSYLIRGNFKNTVSHRTFASSAILTTLTAVPCDRRQPWRMTITSGGTPCMYLHLHSITYILSTPYL